MQARTVSGIFLASVILLLSGCKDSDRPTSYSKGVYGGKADTKLTSEQVRTLRQRGMSAYQ